MRQACKNRVGGTGNNSLMPALISFADESEVSKKNSYTRTMSSLEHTR